MITPNTVVGDALPCAAAVANGPVSQSETGVGTIERAQGPAHDGANLVNKPPPITTDATAPDYGAADDQDIDGMFSAAVAETKDAQSKSISTLPSAAIKSTLFSPSSDITSRRRASDSGVGNSASSAQSWLSARTKSVITAIAPRSCGTTVVASAKTGTSARSDTRKRYTLPSMNTNAPWTNATEQYQLRSPSTFNASPSPVSHKTMDIDELLALQESTVKSSQHSSPSPTVDYFLTVSRNLTRIKTVAEVMRSPMLSPASDIDQMLSSGGDSDKYTEVSAIPTTISATNKRHTMHGLSDIIELSKENSAPATIGVPGPCAVQLPPRGVDIDQLVAMTEKDVATALGDAPWATKKSTQKRRWTVNNWMR